MFNKYVFVTYTTSRSMIGVICCVIGVICCVIGQAVQDLLYTFI